MESLFKFNSKLFKIILGSIVFTEFFSLYGFAYPFFNKILFILFILGIFYLSWEKLTYGVYIVLVELIIASKGYLFFWEIGNRKISLRVGIFFVLMVVWVIKLFLNFLKKKKIKNSFLNSKLFFYYLVFSLFLFWGFFRGIALNNLGNVFFDFNGWLYFVLIFPFFKTVNKDGLSDLLNVFLAAIVGLSLKTFIILFIFSQHSILIIPEIYRWIRTTGVGEIVNTGSGFYRIFFQSHIFAVLGFLMLFPLLNKKIVQHKESIKNNYGIIFLVISLLAVVIISLSRSFWVGLVFAIFIFYLGQFFIFKEKIKQIITSWLMLIIILLASIFLITVVVKIPQSFTDYKVNLSSTLSKRSTNFKESAISSRWNLIIPLWRQIKKHPIIGSGFGKTVTYKTLDPRALKNNPNGLYTTYTFEWGYLDIWLKLGIFGLLAYLIFLWQIFKNGWQLRQNKLFLGSLLGLIALIIIHFFTPYLNHPLGIGYLLVLTVIYDKYKY